MERVAVGFFNTFNGLSDVTLRRPKKKAVTQTLAQHFGRNIRYSHSSLGILGRPWEMMVESPRCSFGSLQTDIADSHIGEMSFKNHPQTSKFATDVPDSCDNNRPTSSTPHSALHIISLEMALTNKKKSWVQHPRPTTPR